MMSTSDTLTVPQAFDSPMTPYAGGHSGSRTLPSFTGAEPEVDPWDAALGVPPERPASPDLLDDGIALRSPFSPQTIPSISHTPALPDGSDASTDVERYVPLTKTQRLYYVIARTCYILFPSLHYFRSKGFLGKIASLFAACCRGADAEAPYRRNAVQEPREPEGEEEDYHAAHDTPLVESEVVMMERTLVAEEAIQEDLYEMKYNKCLMAAQCVLGPLFYVAALFGGVERFEWFLTGTAIGGVAIGLLVVVFADEKAKSYPKLSRRIGLNVDISLDGLQHHNFAVGSLLMNRSKFLVFHQHKYVTRVGRAEIATMKANFYGIISGFPLVLSQVKT
ncbi:hypothetical protein ID866_12074 [Astraeus odoratus]|nr:hypothetical protein ID866_12074 [Astraeus odoratus]